jgi:hypothetical protein
MPTDQPTPCGNVSRRQPFAPNLACELPAGHHGVHGYGNEAWVDPHNPPTFPPTFTQSDVDAAYERGKAEARPSAADVAILRDLLMSLPYWPAVAFAALDRIEGVEPDEPETEAPDA